MSSRIPLAYFQIFISKTRNIQFLSSGICVEEVGSMAMIQSITTIMILSFEQIGLRSD